MRQSFWEMTKIRSGYHGGTPWLSTGDFVRREGLGQSRKPSSKADPHPYSTKTESQNKPLCLIKLCPDSVIVLLKQKSDYSDCWFGFTSSLAKGQISHNLCISQFFTSLKLIAYQKSNTLLIKWLKYGFGPRLDILYFSEINHYAYRENKIKQKFHRPWSQPDLCSNPRSILF